MNHSHTGSKNRCNSRALKPNYIRCHTTRCLLRTMLRNLASTSPYYKSQNTRKHPSLSLTAFMAQHFLLPPVSMDFTLLSDLHFLLSALFANYYIISHQIIILVLKPPLDIDTL
ncbi:hypothetical protein H8959_009149 [Pygathrix nigripes]